MSLKFFNSYFDQLRKQNRKIPFGIDPRLSSYYHPQMSFLLLIKFMPQKFFKQIYLHL